MKIQYLLSEYKNASEKDHFDDKKHSFSLFGSLAKQKNINSVSSKFVLTG